MARMAKSSGRRSLKIRSGDRVRVIAGKDRGKSGRVMRVEPAKERVYVEGLNILKRHQRPTPGGSESDGGVIERPGPIHISNVVLLDPSNEQPTRIGIERENGKRHRVAKRTGKRLD